VIQSRAGLAPSLERGGRRARAQLDWGARQPRLRASVAKVSDSIGTARPTGEDAQLRNRIEELTPVLIGLAGDLARARRESLALRRENDRLRSRLAMLERSPVASGPAQAPPAAVSPPERSVSRQRLSRRPAQPAW
jgi:hypothetical protein